MAEKQKLTDLQSIIIDLMKEKDTYKNEKWGFSAMGFREIAQSKNLKAISVSNAMRSLFKKGVFYRCTSKDQWDDTTYYLANPEISKLKPL